MIVYVPITVSHPKWIFRCWPTVSKVLGPPEFISKDESGWHHHCSSRLFEFFPLPLDSPGEIMPRIRRTGETIHRLYQISLSLLHEAYILLYLPLSKPFPIALHENLGCTLSAFLGWGWHLHVQPMQRNLRTKVEILMTIGNDVMPVICCPVMVLSSD